MLARTKDMADEDPSMVFEMISPAEARTKVERAIAAGECPVQPDEFSNVASTRAILRARAALLARCRDRRQITRALLLTWSGDLTHTALTRERCSRSPKEQS